MCKIAGPAHRTPVNGNIPLFHHSPTPTRNCKNGCPEIHEAAIAKEVQVDSRSTASIMFGDITTLSLAALQTFEWAVDWGDFCRRGVAEEGDIGGGTDLL